MRLSRIALAAVAPLLIAAAPAPTVPVAAGEDARIRQIQLLNIRMEQGGWSAQGQPALVRMPGGVRGGQDFPLRAGTGFAVAITCGNECDGMQVSLAGPSGQAVAAGYDTGEGWTLEAEIPETGAYRLGVILEGCDAPCGVGVMIYTR